MSKKRVVDVDQLRDLIEFYKLQHWKVSEITGIPAKKIKKVSDKMKEVFGRTSNNYIKYAKWFK